MKKFISFYGEATLVLVLYLAFYLTRKGYLPDAVYITMAVAGIAWYGLVKVYLRIVDTDSSHKVLYTVGSLVMGGLIFLSLAGLYMDHTQFLRTAARVLFYGNILLMLYGFFKAVEGHDYIAQLAMIFFANAIVDKLG